MNGKKIFYKNLKKYVDIYWKSWYYILVRNNNKQPRKEDKTMTKKAEKLLNNYYELMNNHVNFTKTHTSTWNTEYAYIENVYNDFFSTINGMHMFGVLSETDLQELTHYSQNVFNSIADKLYELLN